MFLLVVRWLTSLTKYLFNLFRKFFHLNSSSIFKCFCLIILIAQSTSIVLLIRTSKLRLYQQPDGKNDQLTYTTTGDSGDKANSKSIVYLSSTVIFLSEVLKLFICSFLVLLQQGHLVNLLNKYLLKIV